MTSSELYDRCEILDHAEVNLLFPGALGVNKIIRGGYKEFGVDENHDLLCFGAEMATTGGPREHWSYVLVWEPESDSWQTVRTTDYE